MSSPLHLTRLVVRIATLFGLLPRLARLLFGQRIAAVLALTWKAAFRYKLFWVIAVLMLAAVVGLPILVHDDGTAAGFAQILITYTLGAVTALLGLCTLWLACGTLARDVEDCQMQMVVVKPIARWQIWLGKWLGLVTLNAALLALAGVSVFCLLQWRAKGLPPKELAKLKNEVLVARGSAKEGNHDADIENGTEQIFQERLKKLKSEGVNLEEARKQIREQIKAYLQVVPPDGARGWLIRLGSAAAERLKDQPLSLRVKFNASEYNHPETFYAVFFAGVPQKTKVWRSEVLSLAPDTFHEFTIPPNLFEPNGDLTIVFRNLNELPMLFSLDEGMEVLYAEGTFGGSFIRGLGIILCWLALLAALGLAASSCLSFPVAAFVCLSILVMSLSSGTLSTVVEDKTIMGFDEEKSAKGHSPVDVVAVPFFQGVLTIVNLVQQFSPVDSLSTGRDVTWAVLGKAVAEVVLLLGGILGLIGVFLFSRRELATAQGTQ